MIKANKRDSLQINMSRQATNDDALEAKYIHPKCCKFYAK